ncbi:MAG: hypothetical protein HQL36_05750 [Alphaproteobacteria bacterium]|nr:hypothetical protein [Alphaproteobacteria bacterium]MBF0250400.1 hypothetical protein [Alphaproteobacteria bacterium]
MLAARTGVRGGEKGMGADLQADATAARRRATADAFRGRSVLPVFDGFVVLGLTGRDIAELVCVTPPTVSKWRSGVLRIPGDKLTHLTLVLAHLLDEAKAHGNENVRGGDGAWALNTARERFASQDALNRNLPVTDVREGALRFRNWWASGAARRWHEDCFRPALKRQAANEPGKAMRVEP